MVLTIATLCAIVPVGAQSPGGTIGFAFDVEQPAELLRTLIGVDDASAKVSGVLRPTAKGFAIDRLRLSVGTQVLEGNLEVNSTMALPVVHARLRANRLVIAPDISFYDHKPADSNAALDTAIPYQWADPEVVLLDIELVADSAQLAGVEFGRIQLAAMSNSGGPLDLKLTGKLLGGEVTLDADVESANESISIAFDGARLEPGQMASMRSGGRALINGARTQIRIKAKGSGPTGRQVIASLNGRAMLESGPGTVVNNPVDRLGTGVFYTLLQSLNPFAERRPVSDLDCVVARMLIVDGAMQADQTLAMQTDQVNVLASGIVDLNKGTLEIIAKPTPRAQLTPSLGDFAGDIHLSGPIADPKVALEGLNPMSIGAGLATGGLSLLADGLFNRVSAPAQPCAMARTRTLAAQPPTRSQGVTATPAQNPPASAQPAPATQEQERSRTSLGQRLRSILSGERLAPVESREIKKE